MELLTVAQAADRLGVSNVAAYKMLTEGRLTASVAGPPALVSVASVARVAADRRTEALARVGDESAYAAQIAAALRPPAPATVTLADGREVTADGLEAVRAMQRPPAHSTLRTVLRDTSAVALWGKDAITAAALPEGSCRWCYATNASRVHELPPPRHTEALSVLLGEPCPRDLQRWRAEGERVRTVMGQRRAAEMTKRREAEQASARAEFARLQREAQTAASRVRSAARQLAAVDPRIARQAGAEARRRHEQSTLSAQERQRLAVVRQRKAQLRWEP